MVRGTRAVSGDRLTTAVTTTRHQQHRGEPGCGADQERRGAQAAAA
jgi:hypothetical protein